MDYNKAALKMHKENKGKIGVVSKVAVKTRDDLSTAYTPGVAEPCRKIRDDKKEVYRYTAKGNLVAVVSDGTAVSWSWRYRTGSSNACYGRKINLI